MRKGSKAKAGRVVTSRIRKETMPVADVNQSDEQQGEEYIVEKILDKMVQQNQVFYLIKWKGYPVEESTWEPEENCKSSKDLIRKFEQTGQKKKSRKRVSESSQQVTLTKCGRAEPAEVPTDEGGAEAHGGMMASPPRERDTGTENLEGEAKREEDISCIVEAADAPETDDAQPDAEKSANEGDWDATNKLPSTPEPQERSSDGTRADVLIQEMMNEEDGEDHITRADRQLRVFHGVRVESIVGVSRRTGNEELKALVRYEDERYEMVPTRVLHIVAPRVLLKYYEANLRFRSLIA
uniref:Chromo domain-containing protein n=1 Tax=Parascaris univalens TaxID=6257 RepID=A0A915AGZ8_PARUN